MAKSIDSTAPPFEVLIEFLRLLHGTLQEGDTLVPVVRGSFLLKHWFGDDARPAADIDLECFERSQGQGHGRFQSIVEYGRTLCMYAVQDTQYFQGSQTHSSPPEIEFQETNIPQGGSSLWEYGTPGERCYTGWRWRGQENLTGHLQIDIAQAGAIELADIGVEDIGLCPRGHPPFDYPAYTPEMLLAAKLSWLMRSLQEPKGGKLSSLLRTLKRGNRPVDSLPPEWTGEPKDLFDAHLLLTKGDLRADIFEKSLFAVGAEASTDGNNLDWNNLEAIFAARRKTMKDEHFANWNEFQRRHEHLLDRGPAAMLRTIADRLEPLLGEFRQHVPFLQAINADPVDEVPYLIYADWLEEVGSPGTELEFAL